MFLKVFNNSDFTVLNIQDCYYSSIGKRHGLLGNLNNKSKKYIKDKIL